MSNLSFLNSNELISNNSTNSQPTLDELLNSLGFSQWLTLSNSFVLPIISAIGTCLCLLSVYIFFQPKFADPVFVYFRLLCYTYIIHLIFAIPYGLFYTPRYFPQIIDTYWSTIYSIFYVLVSVILFHFEDTLQMAILLTRMKIFSPFVNSNFTLKPRIVSLIFFLTCLCINLPLAFSFKIVSFGTYSEQNQIKTFYSYNSSDFSLTPIGQILIGFTQLFLNQLLMLFVGLIMNIVSVWQYKSYLRERRERDAVYIGVAFSESAYNQNGIATIQVVPTSSQRPVLTPKELKDRKAERNMFYMALTLSTISILSRILQMFCYIFVFFFNNFSNSLIVFLIGYSIQVIVPSSSVFVFYFFNKIFRQEFKKRISSKIKLSSTKDKVKVNR
jgi:hypothetical protein